jgi:NADH-quinone oxidoreductase subunit J
MALFFYFFALLMIISGICVITSRNPVHAVLWLILTFCNASGLMILIGAEFIAMMLIIIYVGAVAVLFLFVVMMLDIKFAEFKGMVGPETGFAALIALLLFVDLVVIILLGTNILVPISETSFTISSEISNSHAIGRLLYTYFVLPFQTSGIILFVAMIATISLTFRLRAGVKRQKVHEQMQRNKENSLLIADVDCKKGLSELKYED